MTIFASVGPVKSAHATSLADAIAAMGFTWFNSILINSLPGGSCADEGKISDILCGVISSSSSLPGLLTALGYLFGVLLAVAALFKLKDHVLNPSQTPLSDVVKRFVAGGALFSLPIITQATQNLLTGGNNDLSSVGLYNGSTAGGSGLDGMLVALFTDIYQPMMGLIFAFGYMAGIVLVMVGISRILKTAQDGPRGPASMGTIMTFVIAGVLFSLSTIMGTFSNTMFGDTAVATYAMLETSTGDIVLDQHVLAMISTVLVFMTIIGYISFLRGFFIIKDVAEGSGQASLMAGVTHIFGGALAVNLGPLLNAVQSTLGLSSFGITFY